jgi:hypothetical protein
MASGIYTSFKTGLMTKTFNLSTDTINVALMGSGFSFNASNTIWSNVSGNEMSGTNYSAGGIAITGLSVTNPSAAIAQWGTSNNSSWASASFTAYFAVIYDITASNDLICAIDFGGGLAVSTGTFTIQWSASGIIQLN